VEKDLGSYDPRDWQSDMPFGFENLANQWLELRKQQIEKRILSESTWRSYRNYLTKAIAFFGQKSVKKITSSEIEDFLLGIKNISEKTRANHKSCLHS
jgi:site-specific recombinase XerD